MDKSELGKTAPLGHSEERVFLYEVLIRQSKNINTIKLPQRRSGRFLLQVSYSRMQQVMREIGSQGGEIISIKPLTGNTKNPEKVLNSPWWVEIKTTQPNCIYYFGPFDSLEEAQYRQGGYVEDLELEGAENIGVEIRQFNPKVLTIEW